ncbi:MAG: hypothetical protein J2P21_28005 [Chloracidobacterium sp.]|nr:hypothetical protein [Chloracidobacterium sp.]
MSTKATIAHGNNFHFYHEVLDDNHVYLELEGMEFEAGYNRVMVSIPIHIWETIRGLGAARLDLVNHTDEDLLAMIEADVDERIGEYQEALHTNPDLSNWLKFLGCLTYGGADEPREEQIKRGMDYYRGERQRQREVHEAIIKLREEQRR